VGDVLCRKKNLRRTAVSAEERAGKKTEMSLGSFNLSRKTRGENWPTEGKEKEHHLQGLLSV